jgi:hypothetical protein
LRRSVYKTVSQGASFLFLTFLATTSPVGAVNRVVKFRNKEIRNHTFEDFLIQEGRPLPEGYRMAFLNPQAGFQSVGKYQKEQPWIKPVAFDHAVEFAKSHFIPHLLGAKVISAEAAMKEMNMTSSCGYPWNLRFKNKSDFMTSECVEIFEQYWEELATDSLSYPLWTCAEKGELRSVKKLALNKIRTFTGSPIEHSVCTNRLFYEQNELFYKSANRTWSFVGTSKYYGGFDRLYRRLSKHPHTYELDESDYDSSLFERLMRAVCDLRVEALGNISKKNTARAKRVYDHIINSVIVLENGELYQKTTGNPSGSANTIVDNTIALYILLAYAWMVLAPPEMRNVQSFSEHVEAALNGDDNTFTVSEVANKFFNAATIAAVWKELGVTTKTPCWESRPLADVSFLSQKFVKYPAGYLPYPETDKVLCSLLYGSEVNDIRWHYLRACALRMDSWPNQECRDIIQSYISYLNVKYSSMLRGSIRGLDMKDVRSSWKSDTYLYSLYTGSECGEKEVPVPYKILKYINNISDYQEEYCVPNISSEVKQSNMVNLNKKQKKNPKRVARVVQVIKQVKPQHKLKKKGILERGVNLAADIGKGVFKTITGLGAYHINGGKLGMGHGPPMFSGGAAPHVRHREYIGDVSGSTAWQATSYRINPASEATFPWLNKLGDRFEQYRLHGAVFEFVSTSADSLNSTNTALGTVIGAVVYDTKRNSTPGVLPTFNNKLEMENYQYAISGRPSRNYMYPVELAKSQTPLTEMYLVDDYDFANDQNTVGDSRFNDVGVFVLATIGMQASAVIGELWVTYDVELIKPRIDSPPPALATPSLHITATNPINAVSPAWSSDPGSTIAQVGLSTTAPSVTTYQTYFPSTRASTYDATIVVSTGTGNPWPYLNPITGSLQNPQHCDIVVSVVSNCTISYPGYTFGYAETASTTSLQQVTYAGNAFSIASTGPSAGPTITNCVVNNAIPFPFTTRRRFIITPTNPSLPCYMIYSLVMKTDAGSSIITPTLAALDFRMVETNTNVAYLEETRDEMTELVARFELLKNQNRKIVGATKPSLIHREVSYEVVEEEKQE